MTQQKQPSMAARGLQALTTPIFGGTKEGVDPDAQYRKDIAMLHAYNQQLACMKCKTFDLEAELSCNGDFDADAALRASITRVERRPPQVVCRPARVLV